jgi:hypothetical protein
MVFLSRAPCRICTCNSTSIITWQPSVGLLIRTGPDRLPATQQHLLPNAQDKIDAFSPERNAKPWSLISSCDVGTPDVFLQLILFYYWLQDGAQVSEHVAAVHCHELCLMMSMFCILLSVFVGECIEYKKTHGASNIKVYGRRGAKEPLILHFDNCWSPWTVRSTARVRAWGRMNQQQYRLPGGCETKQWWRANSTCSFRSQLSSDWPCTLFM